MTADLNPWKRSPSAKRLKKMNRGCSRKLAFATEGEARLKAVKQRPVPFEVYRCKYGPHWHLTTPRKGDINAR